MPAPPNNIVESYFVLPAEFHAKESVPFWRGELLSVSYGHALEKFCQRHVNQVVSFSRSIHQSHRGPEISMLKEFVNILLLLYLNWLNTLSFTATSGAVLTVDASSGTLNYQLFKLILVL